MQNWVENVMWWQVYPLGFVGAEIRPSDDTQHHSDAEPADQPLVRIETWLDHVIELGLNGLQLGPIFASSTHGYDTVDYFRIDPRLGDERGFDRLVDAAHSRGIRVLLDGVFNHVSRQHPAFVALSDGPDAPTADLFRVRWDGWSPGDPVDADVFEGHEQLVALNHSSQAVEDMVVDVMNHWLARGADGWRLDAAYAVPSEFWARVLKRVRAEHPDVWITAEVIHGDFSAIARESTVDSITQYELWQGIWHGIADGNLFELAHAIERNNEFLETFVPSSFIGNHDVTRIASAVGTLAPHAAALLFTLAGVPSVWAGDEYAYEGVKEERIGGDDVIRPEFPPVPPAPLPLYKELIALRRQHAWLVSAHSDVVEVRNGSIVIRTATPSDAIITALNITDAPVTLPDAGADVVLAGSAVLDGGIQLPAFGWAVLGSGATSSLPA